MDEIFENGEDDGLIVVFVDFLILIFGLVWLCILFLCFFYW